jgi:hypothetical protein
MMGQYSVWEVWHDVRTLSEWNEKMPEIRERRDFLVCGGGVWSAVCPHDLDE